MNFWLLALLSRNNLAISKPFLSRAIFSTLLPRNFHRFVRTTTTCVSNKK